MKPTNATALIRALEEECNIKLSEVREDYFMLRERSFVIKDEEVISLNLFNCQLISVPQSLSAFTSLESLHLEGNEITDISPLIALQQLEALRINNNKISDISPLKHLSKLQYLYLGNNFISDISPLKAYENLKSLDISYNNINSISILKRFKYLQYLSLSSNHNLTRLRTLKYMVNLRDLHLSGLPVKRPFSFASLKKLMSLDLSRCNISDISFLTEMPSLTHLFLRENNIRDIKPVSHLKKLLHLELQQNYIKDISPLTDIIDHLRRLRLQSNDIRELPRWFFEKMSKFNAFSYSDNPIENIPPEILKLDDVSAILDYLKSINTDSQPINEIKVILLGDGSAGKTSLLNHLLGRPFNPSESQTHGINLQNLKLDNGVTIKLWDFGGQDIMHHTHQFFLTQNSIYILLLNARENSDTEKWLKLIQVFGGDSPVIIVTNKIDENASAHENIKYLNTKYPNINSRYVKISCRKKTGIAEFKKMLTTTVNGLGHVRTLWSGSWLKVKEELETMREGHLLKDYIHYDKYEELCDKFEVPILQRDTLIKWLHQLGVITYFSDHGLSETHVINPSWITQAFYTIINSRLVASHHGKFHLKQLERILHKTKYPAQKHAFLLNLMKKFELCYQIDEENFILPDLLSKEEPDFEFPEKGLLTLKVKYKNLLPKSVLPKFMVRRHEEIHQDIKWRTGLVISNPFYESTGLIRVDQEDKEITCYVHGQEKRGYIAGIVSDFEKINKLYEGLDYEICIRCFCPQCRHSDKPHYFDYNALISARDNNNDFHLCKFSGQRVRINELLGVLMTRKEMEQEIEKLIGTTSYKIKKTVENGITDELIRIIQSVFSSVSYLLFDNTEKSYHVPLHVMLRAIFGSAVVSDEMQAAGRADIILKTEHYIYIFEIKLDGSSIDAISQIHRKKYYLPYDLENKKIILVGLNFSSQTRNIHDFKIASRDPVHV